MSILKKLGLLSFALVSFSIATHYNIVEMETNDNQDLTIKTLTFNISQTEAIATPHPCVLVWDCGDGGDYVCGDVNDAGTWYHCVMYVVWG